MQGKLFIISGSSGVGKGTLIKRFMDANPTVKFSVSATTRTPRPGETNGVNYFYISEDDFKKSINNNEFLEWAVFSEHFYGTKQSIVEDSLKNGNDIILEIDTQGAFQVKEKIKDAISIFILPPSIEILEQRLRGRHTEDEASIQLRLDFVRKELKASEKFDYKIVNDNLEEALCSLQDIYNKERNS
ncbi:MAG: guanylate kinase [Candidatus Gastranaerophilales bacterium]|nr:guanylate kinase [Candidatus Gastranaerophilales bacterium]